MAKSIVTGGAGFIGSYVAEKLLSLGHTVSIIDDLSTGQRENVSKEAEFHEMSLGSSRELDVKLDQILDGADFVFHLAANPRTSDGLDDPQRTNIQTVQGTVQLLDRMRRIKKIPKMILTSSCAIYGLHDETPITETDAINLGTPYAVQKYAQELYTRTFAELYAMPAVLLRYFNVYGTKRQAETGSYPNVIASFSKSKRESGRLWITGDGTQSRDFVHVFDVVDANVAAMNTSLTTVEAFNIGAGNSVSMNDIAKFFDCPIDYKPARPGDVKSFRSDSSKAKKLLGWEAHISFSEGMHTYFYD